MIKLAANDEDAYLYEQSTDMTGASRKFARQSQYLVALDGDDWFLENVRQLPPVTKRWKRGGGLSYRRCKTGKWMFTHFVYDQKHVTNALVGASSRQRM